jgi:dipeptidyl aminopeptidase/acylaminoacyl peptidase
MGIFRRNKYKFFILGIIIFLPVFSFASGLNYGDILSQGADSFVMQYGNTENPDFYNCTVSTLACSDAGKTRPTLISQSTPTPHFSFTTTSLFKNNIHIRNFYLINNVTGKTYTQSYKLGSWDTLGDEGTIVAFSPDYTRMVYQVDSSGYPVLYSLNLATLKGKTFKGTKVFSKSFTVSGFILTTPNDLYFMSNKDSPYAWNLYKYDFAKKITTLMANDTSYAHKIRKFNNGFVFFAIQGSSSFPEFYNTTTDQIEKFSGFTTDDSINTFDSKDVSFGGGMHGVLMTPQNFDKSIPHTLVIWLHGGPYRQTSVGFQPYPGYAVYDLMLNQLAENNVVVLKLDYRGSYGYGAAFTKSILENVGKGDVADVMSSLKLIKKDMSISNTYLLGNSYGGYLALRSIVAYPKSFSGAISINGVTDWGTMLTAMKVSIFNVDFNGIPGEKNANLYSQASILSRVANLTDQKIILIQSQADKTIPPSQADLLLSALQNKGKNVTFYPYENEDHTITKTADLDGICKNIFTSLALPINESCSFQ